MFHSQMCIDLDYTNAHSHKYTCVRNECVRSTMCVILFLIIFFHLFHLLALTLFSVIKTKKKNDKSTTVQDRNQKY